MIFQKMFIFISSTPQDLCACESQILNLFQRHRVRLAIAHGLITVSSLLGGLGWLYMRPNVAVLSLRLCVCMCDA